MRILQLVPRLPFPPTDGGKIGILGILNGYLSCGHEVWIAGFDDSHDRENFQTAYGSRIHACDSERLPLLSIPRAIAAAGLFGTPYLRAKYWSKGLAQRVASIYEAWRPDIVHIDHSHMGAYGLLLKQKYSDANVYIRAHNIEAVIWERLADTKENHLMRALLQRQARAIREYESWLFNSLNGVIAITSVDAMRIRERAPMARVHVMHAGCELQEAVPLRSNLDHSPRLCFVGLLDWIANRDGIVWFAEHVWPAIRTRWPEASLDVIGRSSHRIGVLSVTPGIRYHGFVPNLAEVLRGVDLAVVPLRIGGGMRIKILDFLSRGLPTIATTIGAEGVPFEWRGSAVMECADSAEDFVAAIAKLTESFEKRQRLASTGRSMIAEEYEWTVLIAKFCEWASKHR